MGKLTYNPVSYTHLKMKVLEKNGQVIEGNFEEKEVKEAFWHTSAHVLAQAVKRLYPCLLYTSFHLLLYGVQESNELHHLP